MNRWRVGEVVLRREWLHGPLWTVIPTRVVLDEPDLLVVFLATGTPLGFPEWPLERHQHPWQAAGYTHWSGHGKLMLHRPGDPYSVDLFWTSEERLFSGFYINLQAPFVRHERGFDTLDHELDLWWPAGEAWVWKDVDEFEKCVTDGRFSSTLGDQIRTAGAHAAAMLTHGPHWFDTGWDAWAPPADWNPPDLPASWNRP